MSRHKLVKNLDLDDELDDFDGGEEYDEDGTGAEGLFPTLCTHRLSANKPSAELSEEDQGLPTPHRTTPRSSQPKCQARNMD